MRGHSAHQIDHGWSGGRTFHRFTHSSLCCNPPLQKPSKSHRTKRGTYFCPGMMTSPQQHKCSRGPWGFRHHEVGFFGNKKFLWLSECGRVTSQSLMVSKYKGICIAFGNTDIGRGQGPSTQDCLEEKIPRRCYTREQLNYEGNIKHTRLITCMWAQWSQHLLSFHPLDTELSVNSWTDPQCQVRLWPKCLIQMRLMPLWGTR